MNENSDLLPNLLHEEFEMQMRGYSRRQVDYFVARRNNEIRELEQRLARALDDSEHLRREVAALRQQALASRPAHEEVSERIAQILKLADDEAKAQKNKADDEIVKLRAEAQQQFTAAVRTHQAVEFVGQFVQGRFVHLGLAQTNTMDVARPVDVGPMLLAEYQRSFSFRRLPRFGGASVRRKLLGSR